jgi:hypothetical protein
MFGRSAQDSLHTAETVVTGRAYVRGTVDHLFSVENAVAFVQVGGPWQYPLPFPTGNSPVLSNLKYVDP